MRSPLICKPESTKANRLAQVMVAQDGEVPMHVAMGYQNVEDQVPMSTDTIFESSP